MIPVSFDALTMFMVAKVVFGCIATTSYLPFGAILLKEYFALVEELETKLRNVAPPHLPI